MKEKSRDGLMTEIPKKGLDGYAEPDYAVHSTTQHSTGIIGLSLQWKNLPYAVSGRSVPVSGFFCRKSLAFGQKAFVTLIGGAGGRTDHFLSIYNLFGTKIAPDAWLCGEQVLWKAERSSFEISGLKAGDVISVARAFGKNHGGKIRSQGLEWESSLFRKKGMPSGSNTIKEEWAKKSLPVKIDFLRGSFVLIAPLFASVRLSKGSKKK